MTSTIARQLKVSRQSVSRWYTEWRRGGARALHGAERAGRKPRLDPRQLRKVEQALWLGARANGFDTDLWTLPRVALVLERVTGVHYHPGHADRYAGSVREARAGSQRAAGSGFRQVRAGRRLLLSHEPGEADPAPWSRRGR